MTKKAKCVLVMYKYELNANPSVKPQHLYADTL